MNNNNKKKIKCSVLHERVKREKRQLTEGNKIFVKYPSDKKMISRI
jgi:hypothetical protein